MFANILWPAEDDKDLKFAGLTKWQVLLHPPLVLNLRH